MFPCASAQAGRVPRQGGRRTLSGTRGAQNHRVPKWRGIHEILGDRIIEDLPLWIGELTTAVKGDHSPAMPSPAKTVFVIPPLPAFHAFHEFVLGGGTLFKLLGADSRGGGMVAKSSGNLR